MKVQINSFKLVAILAIVGILPVSLFAQLQGKIDNLRAYDQSGINVFENLKVDNTPFDGLKVRLGAGFTQQFQNLKHENPGALKNNQGSFSAGTTGNQLKVITSGFQTAQANAYLDVQLADGISMNVTTYMSAKHHNETWVKGGYIKFDKVPFKGQFWSDLMKVVTMKVGHFEVNYGDEHFRRSDGGQALYNAFMEGNIMDEFATEIGTEIYVSKNGLFGKLGVTGGTIKGNVDSLYAASNPDGDLSKAPSILLKAGWDKKLDKNTRVRLSASYYGNQSCGGNTLFGGDRTGSNYQFVMEQNSANPSSTTGAGTPLAFSGRFNPNFGKKINTFMFNGLFKYSGFEFFGTYESASGRTATETSDRKASQYAVEGIYRFGKTENVFLGVRYNSVTATLQNNAKGTGAGAIVYNGDVSVNRVAIAAGWFMTKNVLLKAEYVNQKYLDFPTADYRCTGKFNGYVIEAVVGF